MKKSIAILLVLIVSMSMLAGCSKKKETKEPETQELSYTKGTSDGGLDFNPEDYVTLGDYKQLSSYEVKCSASDEELESYIEEELLEDAKYPKITDRGAQKGDIITFDYETTVDGKKVEDCTYNDYEITVGDDEFDKVVEKEMLGKKAGESFEVELTLSEDLSASNSGDNAVMKVTVKKLEEQILPEFDDDYAKEKGYDNVDDFKKAMREQIISDKEDEYFSTLTEDLMIAVADNATLKDDYPQSLYDTCKEVMLQSLTQQIDMIEEIEDISDYLEAFEMTEKDLDAQYLMITQERLLIYAIAQKEELFLTEEQFQEELEAAATEYEMTVEELEQDYDIDEFKFEAVYNNVLAFLYDNAKKESITEEEYQSKNIEEGDDFNLEDRDIEPDTDEEENSDAEDVFDEEEDSIILDDADENGVVIE